MLSRKIKAAHTAARAVAPAIWATLILPRSLQTRQTKSRRTPIIARKPMGLSKSSGPRPSMPLMRMKKVTMVVSTSMMIVANISMSSSISSARV